MTTLPVRVDLKAGQTLDDWLETLAAHNDMTTMELTKALQGAGASTRFFMVSPQHELVARASELTDVAPETIVGATLARFDHGSPLNLQGLDQRRVSTWRTVAARGWIRGVGTGACPRCLHSQEPWSITWRLPTTTVCVSHGCFLVERCPDCARIFRDHPRTPLRVGAGSCCLNPIGPRSVCEIQVSRLDLHPAPSADIERQLRHDRAVTGGPVVELGRRVPGRRYLADERGLAVLLMHLVAGPKPTDVCAWVQAVREEGSTQGGKRGRRWHLSPPEAVWVRSAALTEASRILVAPDQDGAALALRPWLGQADYGEESRTRWLAEHTSLTPTLTGLIRAALPASHHLSRRLSTGHLRIPQRAVPQMVPPEAYTSHLSQVLLCSKRIGRTYASMCLIRASGGVTTWARAAEVLGIPPGMGLRITRSALARSSEDSAVIQDRILQLGRGLDHAADYRRLEVLISDLTDDGDWFETWRHAHRPICRRSSFPYAVTWLWCQVAGGMLETSPAWPVPPSSSQKVGYRQFVAILPTQAAVALAGMSTVTTTRQPACGARA